MKILEDLCRTANSFFERGYAFGSTGNLSVREGEEVWVTPTGKPLCGLTPASLAKIDMEGRALNGASPSKEYPFHLAIYRRRADVSAIVHLHSTYAVALSCLDEIDESRPLPAITPYFFMRVAPLVVVPYFRPGSGDLAAAVGEAAGRGNTLLLRNHGLICVGETWNEAVDRTEEFEETAKLRFLLRGERVRELGEADLEELRQAFPPRPIRLRGAPGG